MRLRACQIGTKYQPTYLPNYSHIHPSQFPTYKYEKLDNMYGCMYGRTLGIIRTFLHV